MEEMMNMNQAKTDEKFKDLTETIEKNAVGIINNRSVLRRAD
jgi:S-adenosylmethionine:tRNA-ribosyltransferase-isomerase (queuine synthetase)